MIKVSVIVAIYNVEKYLPACLNSLINQTLKDIEIICINDGSKDNSAKILNEYSAKDTRIIVINQENQGVSIARNKGLEIAKGEYIAFCDSDDWVDLNFYEKLYSAAKKHNADIAASSILRKKKGKLEKFYVYNNTYISNNYYEKIKICDVPDFNYIWNKIYKASKFKKTNLKFSPKMTYEDIIFTPQILYYMETLVTVPDAYYYYLMRKDSIVHTKCNNKDCAKATKIALDFLKSKNIPLKKIMPVVKRLQLFGFTIIKKTTRKPNPYAQTKFKRH